MFGFKKMNKNITPANKRTHIHLDELADCVDKKYFSLFYQPIFKAATGEFIGFEVLARLLYFGHLYTPDYFIDQISEKPHLDNKFTLNIFEKAIHFANANSCYLHINIDATQLFNTKVINLLKQALKKKLKICVEILETHKIKDIEATKTILIELKQLGATIALDDFGVGYNNLNYLMQLPIDVVKIDKIFLENFEPSMPNKNQADTHEKKLLSSIISLSHGLDLDVIVEGVETLAQFDYCKNLGVYGIQGFYLGKPMDQVQAVKLLNSLSSDAKE